VSATVSAPVRRRGRWIDDWQPEDPAFWAANGAAIARRNLIFSVFAEHVGFSVWSLWSVLVLFLGPAYHIDPAGKFVLTAVPTAVGSVLRLPYTLAVAKLGGRNWTVISALLLLIPAVAAALVIKPGVSYSTLLLLAAVAGVGGGNFASSMANINAFYPQRLKGRALGLNAGGGNLGVAVVQLAGLAVLAFAGKNHPALVAGVYIPFIVVSALCAALFMDNLTGVRNDRRAMLFVLSGLGNGSAYTMIPAIFRAASGEEHEARRMSGAVIGIAGAAGAFGGVLVNLAFRQSFLTYKTGNVAYLAFIGFYLACMAVTWAVYLRPSPARLAGV
jgi:nitrate/nitrite transporter NarK